MRKLKYLNDLYIEYDSLTNFLFLVKINTDNVLRELTIRNMAQFSRLRLQTVLYS